MLKIFGIAFTILVVLGFALLWTKDYREYNLKHPQPQFVFQHNKVGIKYKLRAIILDSQIEGHMGGIFLLGIGGISGNMKENQYFLFYTEDEDSGAIKLIKSDISFTSIFEKDISIEEAWALKSGCILGISNWSVFVPKGSIKYLNNLDLLNIK